MEPKIEPQGTFDSIRSAWVMKNVDFEHEVVTLSFREAEWIDACLRLAEHAPSSPAAPIVSDWVNCPICGQPDMNKKTDADGNSLISCVNHACWSNGGDYSKCDCAEAVKELRKYLNQVEGETVIGGIRNLAQALMGREEEIEQLNAELRKTGSPAAPTPHKLSFRNWLISGGSGHEDGVDGIRACTLPLTSAIEMVDEYMEYLAEVTPPSPCCANPNMVVKGLCDLDPDSDYLHTKEEYSGACSNWRPTHNVCLNCGKEEKI